MRSRFSRATTVAALLALLAGLAGCGGGDSGGGSTEPPPPPPTPSILTQGLPDGTLGLAYTATLQGTSGTPPFTWSVSAGSLPAGLSLNGETGEITGTPTAIGTSTFTIQVTDSQNQTATKEFTVVIGNPIPLVERVSVAADGIQANGDSGTPAVSDDGRFVVFTSLADNLVPDDTNSVPDIFMRVRDPNCTTTVRVNLASDGTEPGSQSFAPVISSLTNGMLFVAYSADANNLVPDDTNEARDVFVTAVDASSCPPAPVSTVRASVASDGTQSDGDSNLASISANGLVVAYQSNAANLDVGDTNGLADVFITELQFSSGTLSVVRTRRASLGRDRIGIGVPGTTADIFSETTIGATTLELNEDEHVGREILITQGTGLAQVRTIVGNDATTFTVSPAWDTVPDETTVFRVISLEEVTADIFSETTIGSSALTMVDDEEFRRLVEIVAGTGQGQVRSITSNDATTLTVEPAWNPVPDASSVFRLLLQGNATALRAQVSADGEFVAFDTNTAFDPSDDNNSTDMFLHERASRNIFPVSVGRGRRVGDGISNASAVSGDAGQALFHTFADGLTEAVPGTPADIFSETTIGNSGLMLTPDAHVGQRVEIGTGTGAGQDRAITANSATTFTVDPAWETVPDDTSIFRVLDDTNNASDLYVHNRNTGETTRVTLANDGSQANGFTDVVAHISDGGRVVAFTSFSTNLVEADRNALRDVFIRDRQTNQTRRMSRAMDGVNPNAESFDADISADGSTVVFASAANNLVLNDDNGDRDIFLATTGVVDVVELALQTQLPVAQLGVPYQGTLRATGGARPLFWTLAQGRLPPGLFLDSRTGRLVGVPQEVGRFQFVVQVMDSGRPLRSVRAPITLLVEKPGKMSGTSTSPGQEGPTEPEIHP